MTNTAASSLTNLPVQPQTTASFNTRAPGRKRGPRPRYALDQVIEAIVASNGVMSKAGQLLGCAGGTVGNYVRTYPEVAAAHERLLAERRSARNQ